MIGGNTTIEFEIRTENEVNEIGERVQAWNALVSLVGWFDLMGGNAIRSVYSAKIQESTHVVIADYNSVIAEAEAEDVRAVVKGKHYDVTFIDDPMELHKHVEIFLKYVGGQ